MTDADKRELAAVKKVAEESLVRCAEKHAAARAAGEECDAIAFVEVKAVLLESCLSAITADPSGVLKEAVRTYRKSCKQHPGASFTILAQQFIEVLKLAGC